MFTKRTMQNLTLALAVLTLGADAMDVALTEQAPQEDWQAQYDKYCSLHQVTTPDATTLAGCHHAFQDHGLLSPGRTPTSSTTSGPIFGSNSARSGTSDWNQFRSGLVTPEEDQTTPALSAGSTPTQRLGGLSGEELARVLAQLEHLEREQQYWASPEAEHHVSTEDAYEELAPPSFWQRVFASCAPSSRKPAGGKRWSCNLGQIDEGTSYQHPKYFEAGISTPAAAARRAQLTATRLPQGVQPMFARMDANGSLAPTPAVAGSGATTPAGADLFYLDRMDSNAWLGEVDRTSVNPIVRHQE